MGQSRTSMPKGILPHTQGDKGVQGQRRLTTLPAESKVWTFGAYFQQGIESEPGIGID
jgi:predicted NAD/FAD-binding protein